LAESLPESRRDSLQLSEALEKLTTHEVIRPRIDHGNDDDAWQLDHDYLSRGLLELDRRARRWPLLLEESARAFEAARNPVERCKRLLTPRSQIRLFYERLRGRLRYGKAARYAGYSLVRFVFNLWVVLALVAIVVWQTSNVQREVVRLFAVFGERQPTLLEARALWELTNSPAAVRQEFLDTGLSLRNTRRFNRSDRAIYSLVGLNSEIRDEIAIPTFEARCLQAEGNDLVEIATHCTHLLLVTGASTSEWSRHLVGEMSNVKEAWRLGNLAGALAVLGSEVRDQDAAVAARHLLDAIILQPGFLAWMNQPFSALAAKLPPDEAVAGWRRIVASPGVRQYWGALSWEMAPDSREGQGRPPRRARSQNIVRSWVNLDLSSLASRIPPAQARGAWDLFLASHKSRAEAYVINGRTFEALAKRLPVAEARPIFQSILDADVQGEFEYPPMGVLVALTTHFTSRDAEEATERVLGLLESKDVVAAPPEDVLVALAPALSPAAAEKAGRRLLAWAGTSQEPNSGSYLCSSLGAFAPYLDPVATSRLLLNRRYNFSCYIKALAAFGDRLPHTEAKTAWDVLAQELSGPHIVTTLNDDFYTSLRVVSARLLPGEAADTAGKLLSRLQRSSTPDEVSFLSRFLAALGRFDSSVASRLSHRMLARPGGFYGGAEGALKDLAPLLRDVDAEHVLREFLHKARLWISPPCSVAGALARRQDLEELLEVIKWPTCTREDRYKLIDRTLELAGESLETNGERGTSSTDVWRFVEWAERRGLKPADAPEPPPLDDLRSF
jgi:hypothetical protein